MYSFYFFLCYKAFFLRIPSSKIPNNLPSDKVRLILNSACVVRKDSQGLSSNCWRVCSEMKSLLRIHRFVRLFPFWINRQETGYHSIFSWPGTRLLASYWLIRNWTTFFLKCVKFEFQRVKFHQFCFSAEWYLGPPNVPNTYTVL